MLPLLSLVGLPASGSGRLELATTEERSDTVTKFSINLNKVALLRNSRGTNTPDLLEFGERCLRLGVHGITVHPRPDERHTRYADVAQLADLLAAYPGVELNVEGNPTPRFMELVLEVAPQQVTLVPDAEQQLTSDHGWDLLSDQVPLTRIVDSLKERGIRTSLFLDPVPKQVQAAARTGTDRIELYTESYASAFGGPRQALVLAEFRQAAECAQKLGLGVNAGHDLNLTNLATFLQHVPNVLEVSVGHAVICESLIMGLSDVLRRYLELVKGNG